MTDNFIEEAAKALWNVQDGISFQSWEHLSNSVRERYRKKARALLPIIAKHLTSDKAVFEAARGFHENASKQDVVKYLEENFDNEQLAKSCITAALKTLEQSK